MIKLSSTSKMKITGKRVKSWSLPAGSSCPGSSDAEICKSCYAKKGMYHFPSVKNLREHNKLDYHRNNWVDDMVKEVSKCDYFRWFDSGDIETPELATKIAEVCRLCPNTIFWLPTRSDKIPAINAAIVATTRTAYCHSLSSLPNVALRISADNIGLNNRERPGVNSYVINQEDIFEAKRQGIHVCPVGVQPNRKSCNDCTMCYTSAKVAYVLH